MSFTGLWNNTKHLFAFPKTDPQIFVGVKPSMIISWLSLYTLPRPLFP